MKRGVLIGLFTAVLGSSLGALYHTQRREATGHASANAILEIAADTQRDIGRLPMHFTRLSDEEEISIGKDLAGRYNFPEARFTAEELALAAYLEQVGGKLGARAKRRLPYSFHLVPDHNMMNAFSLPGGPVYVGEGLLDLMTTEDELASVLAHEVEHIDHYHCVERVQVAANLKHLDLEALGQLLQLPMDLWQAGYHKEEEMEADREGMFLAVSAGYSPYGAVSMFERFAKLHQEYVLHAQSPEEEFSQLAILSLSGYFRSHPLPSERLAQAQQVIGAEHWEDRKEQRNFRVEFTVKDGKFVDQKKY